MIVTLNLFGAEITLKEKVSLEGESSTVADLMRFLLVHQKGKVERIIRDDLSLFWGWVVLVNGRNILSLDGTSTKISAGDEVTFTVLVDGG